jgi:hypothetical protein
VTPVASASGGAGRDGAWSEVLLWAALVAAYGFTLRRYGLELADEGVLLAQFDRVAHGQVPYRDFHVGYGPASFWLHAASFAAFGASLGTVRTGLALVHAARAAILVHLGRAVGGRRWEVALGLGFVGFFLPVAPGLCVPGNIPYPAWFTDLLGLCALLLLVRERAPMLAIGGLWGLVFAFRQNSGVLGVAAAAVTTVLAAPPTEGGRRSVAVAMGIGLVAGAVLLLHDYLDPLLGVVFLGPLLPLALAVGRRRVGRATLGDLGRLAAGFVVVVGAVVGWTMYQAGVSAVWTEFLHVGGDTIRTYHATHPTLGSLRRELDGVAPARAAHRLADASWFAIFPVVHFAGARLVAAARLRSRLEIALVSAATVGYLQLYPRMDFWHLLPLAPTSLATLALVATTLGATRIAPVLLAVMALGRMVPVVAVLAAVSVPAGTPARIPRLDVRWDLLRDESLTSLPDLVDALRGKRRVAGFPALGVVNFALGEPSPWRHDYFFPGRPLPDEERALAAAIDDHPPDAVVVLEAPRGAFAAAFEAHPMLVEAFARGFVDAPRVGPYRILVPAPPR